MVVFSIGAQILDTILIKSAGIAVDAAITVVSWGAKSLIGIVWKTPISEEQKLRIELLELKKEVEKLENVLSQTTTT
jgi:hypothetical protein